MNTGLAKIGSFSILKMALFLVCRSWFQFIEFYIEWDVQIPVIFCAATDLHGRGGSRKTSSRIYRIRYWVRRYSKTMFWMGGTGMQDVNYCALRYTRIRIHMHFFCSISHDIGNDHCALDSDPALAMLKISLNRLSVSNNAGLSFETAI